MSQIHAVIPDQLITEVQKERLYQKEVWGEEFDKRNTPNDWLAYIAKYLGQALTLPWDAQKFRKALIKVATLCFAAIENIDRGTFVPRHYDKEDENV